MWRFIGIHIKGYDTVGVGIVIRAKTSEVKYDWAIAGN